MMKILMFSIKNASRDYLQRQKTEYLLDSTLGPKYTLWQRIKMGGNGCRRMTVEETSPLIWSKIKKHPGIHYSSIELRPKGIIVYLKNNLRLYSWAIPYYQLALYKSKNFSIHSQGQYVKYKLDDSYRANEKFLSRMKTLRNQMNSSNTQT